MLTDIVEEDNEDNETEEADTALCLLRTCLLLGHNGHPDTGHKPRPVMRITQHLIFNDNNLLIRKDNFRSVGHWSLVLPVIRRNKQAISCREASGRNFNGYQDFILIPTL